MEDLLSDLSERPRIAAKRIRVGAAVDFAFIGLIVAASNKRNQRVGDLVAKTIVIND